MNVMLHLMGGVMTIDGRKLLKDVYCTPCLFMLSSVRTEDLT